MKPQILVRCSLFAALFSLCAWVAIPMGSTVFTLQSFALALMLLHLGGKWGTVTVLVYLLLGAVGVPVFSGFRGGLDALLGPTGGFLWGFLISSVIYWIFWKKHKITALIVAFLACYTCGSLWYFLLYTDATAAAIIPVLLQCVVPFLLPDALKIALAVHISRRVHNSPF